MTGKLYEVDPRWRKPDGSFDHAKYFQSDTWKRAGEESFKRSVHLPED